MKLRWRILSDDEAADYEAELRHRAAFEAVGTGWHNLAVHMCDKTRGHDWWLDIDPDDGTWLHCRRCPATTDDVYPDGRESLTGEFVVYPGYVLGLRCGSVEVNGKWHDGLFTYGWRGPVDVNLHVEKHISMDWIGEEWDVWVEVDPRAGVAA